MFKSLTLSALICGLTNATSTQMFPDCNDEANNENATCEIYKGFGQSQVNIDSLNEYGCWCFFDDDHGRGKAHPVDTIDEMCKILHDGYECAMRDAEAEGDTCVPWEVNYHSAVGGGGESIPEECASVNAGNNCAIRACTVEGTFVANLVGAFTSGASINPDHRHSNGFDFANVCVVKKNGGGPANKECCGAYPERFPYKTAGGDRKCCGNRTFNSLTLKCCDSDTSTVKFNC